MLKRLLLTPTLWILWLVRIFISFDRRTYMVLSAGSLQPLLARIGMMRAQAVFLKARDTCPAYQKFLASEGYDKSDWDLKSLL